MVNKTNPSPHPMQRLASNAGNPQSWRHNLLESIREEGLGISDAVNGDNSSDKDNVLTITSDDIKEEVEYWESAMVFYVLGIKPPFRVINGFIRRMWWKYGIDIIAMGDKGIFVIRFRTKEGKPKAMDAGPFMFDRKLVIMKSWASDLDLYTEEVKVVPT